MRDQHGRRIFNMPVWNALYQVRNFAANIENVRAQNAHGAPIDIVHTGTSEWQVSGPEGCIAVTYGIHLDTSGPFGSQLNGEHAFLNWAMVLMYLPDLRDKPVALRLESIPYSSVRDLHLCRTSGEVLPLGKGLSGSGRLESICFAHNYDELVDSPIEASNQLQEASFQQDGATYRIVVHGNPADFNMDRLKEVLQKITHAGVDWMQDRPYDQYTFLYHFPHGPAGGGMEHAYGTAIDVSSDRLGNLEGVADVSAHEFFHLWNVKRIRPQSLEPIDYQREQDTRALWFSEGVTSTVAGMLLVRAGLVTDRQYLDGVGRVITELQQRPAQVWQSVEDSSLDAWFEGNAFYRSPQRSVSYYNKGQLLGILLDLGIRKLTNGSKSLRDLFQWMNQHYAKQHRYFRDSYGVQEAAETVTGKSFGQFFRDYVSGVKPIPYDEFFEFVGLRVTTRTTNVAWPGFRTTANLGGQPEVVEVDPDSDAQRAGIAKADRVVTLNGEPANGAFEDDIAKMHPGDTITMTLANRRGERRVKLHLASRAEQSYEVQDISSPTPEQRSHRTAWMRGDDEGGGVP